MAIKKVWIEDGCSGCGVCQETCPKVFVVNDEAEVIEGVDYSEFEDEIKEAVESCPLDIIKFEE